jgi:transposase
MSHGQPWPVSDLFGAGGRRLLASLTLPEPWAGTLAASLRLLDELEREIAAIERELAVLGRAHPYVPLLETVPGIGCVLGYTIAAEIGDIARFSSPSELAGYTGLCPRVYQSGESDRRGPLSKKGPRYLRWALIEATSHASRHPAFHPCALLHREGGHRGKHGFRLSLAGEREPHASVAHGSASPLTVHA